jgi:hypothetical protein
MITNNDCLNKKFLSLWCVEGREGIIFPQIIFCDKFKRIWSIKKHVKTPTISEKSA